MAAERRESSRSAVVQEDDQRARLLHEAARLFRTEGYAGASMRLLSERIGIQKASLYHYVESKEDLLYAVCRDGWVSLLAAVTTAGADHVGLAALRAAVRAHLRVNVANQDVYVTMLTESRYLSRARRSEMARRRTEYWDYFLELVTEAQTARELRKDIPAADLMYVLRNTLGWTVVTYGPDDGRDIDGVADLILRVFEQGAVHRAAGSRK
jgi:TetR/AcrR family transcriptional regulator, cholesterol catabolism regulator